MPKFLLGLFATPDFQWSAPCYFKPCPQAKPLFRGGNAEPAQSNRAQQRCDRICPYRSCSWCHDSGREATPDGSADVQQPQALHADHAEVTRDRIGPADEIARL